MHRVIGAVENEAVFACHDYFVETVTSMKTKANVVIVAADPGCPANLREALLVFSFQSTITPSVEEARKLLNSSANALLVLFYGEDLEAGSLCSRELLSFPDIQGRPILLVGTAPSELNGKVSSAFAMTQVVEDVQNHRVIAEEADRLWARYKERQTERLSEIEAALDEAASSKTTSPAPSEVRDSSRGPLVSTTSLSAEFFAQVERLGILRKLIGGAFYARTIRAQPFVDFLNQQPDEVTAGWTQAMEGIDSLLMAHSVRLGYLVNRMLSAVCVHTDLVVAGTRAALLHAASFKTKRRMVVGNYLNPENAALRTRLAKGVRESATNVSAELSLKEESTILAFYARLIAGEDVSLDKPQFLCASVLVAADVLDRVACPNSYFSPQTAYLVLGLCKRGEFSSLHPAAVAALIKFTSEAIIAAPARFALPGALLQAYYVRQAAGEAHAERERPGEKKVPVEGLTPGMRLSRALKTFDGKEVLEADMMLDADLIWRIWRLSALRPVENAMVFSGRRRARSGASVPNRAEAEIVSA